MTKSGKESYMESRHRPRTSDVVILGLCPVIVTAVLLLAVVQGHKYVLAFGLVGLLSTSGIYKITELLIKHTEWAQRIFGSHERSGNVCRFLGSGGCLFWLFLTLLIIGAGF